MGYLLISIAGLGALGVLMRYSVGRGALALPLNLVFRGVVALAMVAFVWAQGGLSGDVPRVWPGPWLLTAASGAFWISGISAIKAVQHGPLGVTWTVLRCSMVLPVAASILVWDGFASAGAAATTAMRVVGIVLGLGTVVFYGAMLQRQRRSDAESDRAWAPWMALAFLSQGAWEICLRATSDLPSGPSRSLFLITVFGASAPDPQPRYRGMMNPDVMRLILESVTCTGEAWDMLERIHRERVYAGAGTATNWMFADAAGRGTRVVQFHERLDRTHDLEGMLAMREDDRGRLVMETLQEADGRIDAPLMNRLSRTVPVLHDTNISAMTATMPLEAPDLFAWAHFAVNHAGRTVYVPLYLGCTATHRALLDGTLYRLSSRKSPSTGPGAADFEAGLDVDRQRVEADARRARRESGKAKARRVLTEGCLQLAQRALDYVIHLPDEF